VRVALALGAGAALFAGIVVLVPQQDVPPAPEGEETPAAAVAAVEDPPEARPADEGAAEPAVAEEAVAVDEAEDVPERPRVDTLRVEPDGTSVIAGQAAAGATVAVLLGAEVLAEVVADGNGAFVALVSLPPSDAPRALSLVADPAGAAVESEGTWLVAPTSVAPVEVAAADVAMDEPEGGETATADARALPEEDTGGNVVAADTPVGEGEVAEAQQATDVLVDGVDVAEREPAAVVQETPVAEDEVAAGAEGASALPGVVAEGEELADAPAPEAVDVASVAAMPAESEDEVAGGTPGVDGDATDIVVVEEPVEAGDAPTGTTDADVATAEVDAAAPETDEADVAGAEGDANAHANEAGNADVAASIDLSAEQGEGIEASSDAVGPDDVVVIAGEQVGGAETEALGATDAPLTVSADEELEAAATDGLVDETPEAVTEMAALEAPPDAAPTAPPVLVSDAEGVRVVQPALAPGSGPEVLATVAVDAIAYDAEGGVDLSGRAAGGGTVRLYLDNDVLADVPVDEDGQWAADLSDVAPGVYTLRVDQIGTDGAVTSRVETPFLREERESIAAAMAEETAADGFAVAVQTVQPGNTLWAIARERYGDGVLYVQVFEANRDRIRNPDLIYPGQIFLLPESPLPVSE
jgi:nucleoid-associated protein YgaU